MKCCNQCALRQGITLGKADISLVFPLVLCLLFECRCIALAKYNVAFNGGMTETVPSVVRGRKPGCIDMRFEQLAARQTATDRHHIFPAAEFPEISTYYENIICITPEQHLNRAHPAHDTHSVNRLYQYYLLLSKMEQIMLNIQDNIGTPGFYSFRKFTRVLDTGLSTDQFGKVQNNDFATVSDLIDQFY